MRWQDTDICYVDVETTGLNPKFSRIFELSLTFVGPDQLFPGASLTWRFNPQEKLHYDIQSLCNVYDEDLQDQPTFEESWPEILETMDGLQLAAYNARFDLPFLESELRRGRYAPIYCNDWIDPFVWARHLLQGPWKLPQVAKKLQIQEWPAHQSAGDVVAAAQILPKLAALYDIPDTLDNLLSHQKQLANDFFLKNGW